MNVRFVTFPAYTFRQGYLTEMSRDMSQTHDTHASRGKKKVVKALVNTKALGQDLRLIHESSQRGDYVTVVAEWSRHDTIDARFSSVSRFVFHTSPSTINTQVTRFVCTVFYFRAVRLGATRLTINTVLYFKPCKAINARPHSRRERVKNFFHTKKEKEIPSVTFYYTHGYCCSKLLGHGYGTVK